jgi:2-keto-3-deoxy-L-rhamnonate aldolase RhmA
VLDRSGGSAVKIIAKIENEAGLENYDDILSVTDGVMVARGDLAMEVRPAHLLQLDYVACLAYLAQLLQHVCYVGDRRRHGCMGGPWPWR